MIGSPKIINLNTSIDFLKDLNSFNLDNILLVEIIYLHKDKKVFNQNPYLVWKYISSSKDVQYCHTKNCLFTN